MFTPELDNQLIATIEEIKDKSGRINWAHVAIQFSAKVKQPFSQSKIYAHYYNQLVKNNAPWTAEEVRQFLECKSEIEKRKWTAISKIIKTKTPTECSNLYSKLKNHPQFENIDIQSVLQMLDKGQPLLPKRKLSLSEKQDLNALLSSVTRTEEVNVKQVAEHLKVSVITIKKRASKVLRHLPSTAAALDYSLSHRVVPRWSKEEEASLLQFVQPSYLLIYESRPLIKHNDFWKYLSIYFNRSPASCYVKHHRLIGSKHPTAQWSPEELDLLKRLTKHSSILGINMKSHEKTFSTASFWKYLSL